MVDLPVPILNAILPALDASRAVVSKLLNPFLTVIRVRFWNASRPGEGQRGFTDIDTPITVGIPPLGPQPVSVHYVSNQEIIASGGLYRDRDLRVGPLTPTYMTTLMAACCAKYNVQRAQQGSRAMMPSSSLTMTQTVDPSVNESQATEIFWNVQGGDMPAGGIWAKKIHEETSALHLKIVLRATGEQLGEVCV